MAPKKAEPTQQQRLVVPSLASLYLLLCRPSMHPPTAIGPERGDEEEEGRKERGGGGGAELAPSKEMDPFIMCTEVGEREGGRSGGAAARPLVARSVR